jgi:hypothetical protein
MNWVKKISDSIKFAGIFEKFEGRKIKEWP